MLQQLSCNLKNFLVDHHICRFLVVHLLIEGFQGVTQPVWLQLLVEQHVLELGNHSVENRRSDL